MATNVTVNAGQGSTQVTVITGEGSTSYSVSAGARGPAGADGTIVIVDQTVIDGSANAVSGNAVFDALALKAPLADPTLTGEVVINTLVGVNKDSLTINNTSNGDGQESYGLKINKSGVDSFGLDVYVGPNVENGVGVYSSVSGDESIGLASIASGIGSKGAAIYSSGDSTKALTVTANGEYSTGIVVESSGIENVGMLINSTVGDYHAKFSDAGTSKSFVARLNGAFGWFRGVFTGRIQAADTLTEDRTYTLPNAAGTVALINPSTGTQTFSGAQTFTNSAIGTGTGVAISGTATSGTILAVSGTASTGGSLFTVNQGSISFRITETGALNYNGAISLGRSGGADISLGGINNANTFKSNNTGSNTATDFVLRGGTADRTAGNLFQVQNFTQPVLTISALTGAGNVGIGTTTPAEKLSVVGNATVSGSLTVSGSTQFASTTRPTSSGTGTPTATSLITLADGDARYGATGLAGTSAISITSQITPQTIRSAELAVGLYHIRMVFLLVGTANTGTRHGYDFSGTATVRFFRKRASSPTHTQQTSMPMDLGLAESSTSAVVEGIISVTVAGTFSMQAAQNTSHPDVLSVGASNHMIITPCPKGSIS